MLLSRIIKGRFVASSRTNRYPTIRIRSPRTFSQDRLSLSLSVLRTSNEARGLALLAPCRQSRRICILHKVCPKGAPMSFGQAQASIGAPKSRFFRLTTAAWQSLIARERGFLLLFRPLFVEALARLCLTWHLSLSRYGARELNHRSR